MKNPKMSLITITSGFILSYFLMVLIYGREMDETMDWKQILEIKAKIKYE